MQLKIRVALAATIGILLAGCATTRPGTGDISFRLLWDGTADLDLHVADPMGRHVGAQMNLTGSDFEQIREQLAEYRRQEEKFADIPKGIRDIDCNADPLRMCKQPIENIFWPAGTAPRGTYQVWVHHFQNVEGTGAVPFSVEVRRGEAVVNTLRGSVDPETPTSQRWTSDY